MTGQFVVLVVDDQASNRFTVKELLAALPGLEVVEAPGGSEALLMVIERKVHLVLLDVQMPGMDGYEVARHLKMTARTREIPIIFLTAVFKADEFVRQGYGVGAVDYLTKPLDDNLLLNRVRLYQDLHEREENLLATLELKHRQDKDLALALERAQAASLSKSEFLANMSHEIRTPMNAIIGMTHLALKSAEPDQQRHYLERIRDAADGLMGIINDILDFSKIEAGKLQMDAREFSLISVLDQVTQLNLAKATEKKLDFRIDLDPQAPALLMGDPLRLGQVLINLVGNAIKFTESGAVTLLASLQRRDLTGGASLLFCVKDTGIGMSADQTRQLFLPFSQVDASSTRKFGGTGLGLAISRRLVELMGGEIWVTSEPGRGSEFCFTVTLAEPVSPAALPDASGPRAVLAPEAAASRLQGAQVLLVEDNEFNQEVGQEILSEMGVAVTLAITGQEALELIRARRFDAVLMDLQMPVLDGYEATRRLRADPAFADLPIVAMTAHAMVQERERCLALGMNDYVTKPIYPEVLAATLARWVRRGG